MKRFLWLLGNVMRPRDRGGWICFPCWLAHIAEYRDVQLGDWFDCSAGKHKQYRLDKFGCVVWGD